MYRDVKWIGSMCVSKRVTAKPSFSVVLMTALLVLGGISTAHGRTDYCVGTIIELETALNAAANDADASQITLKPGSYVLSRNLDYNQFSLSEGPLTVRGGGLGDCTVATPGAAGTTIAGLYALRFSQRVGNIRIEDLSFVGLNVSVRTRDSTLDQVNINRVLMLSSYLEINAASSEVIVRDSVFRSGNNQHSINDFALWLDVSQGVSSDPESIVELINVSVVNAFTRISGSNRARSVGIVNSIFQRIGVELESNANLSVRTSRADNIQMLNGATLMATNVMTASAELNAQFQPLSTSPMLDRGLNALYNGLPPFDVYGEARVIGAGLDIGGAESPVNVNGVVMVTTIANSGAGSLAAAVDFANADPAPNTIRFNIPGTLCPRRILRSSALTITDGVTIDGYSQPGSVLPGSASVFDGEPCILLDGANATHEGIRTGSALNANNESITIKGLAFEDFTTAVSLDHSGNHVLQGNQFGGSIGRSTSVLAENFVAIYVAGDGSTLIGGLSTTQGNLITGSTVAGVRIFSDDNSVVGNQIGYDGSGISSSLANNRAGIFIASANNLIVSNRIGGNETDGITLFDENANGNEIRNNTIGSRLTVPGNGESGIKVWTGANRNQIGPDNEVTRNATGIEITTGAKGRNRISRNSIFSNTGLGLDIAAPGVTLNDNDETNCNLTTSCPSNNNQNYPKLASAAYQPPIDLTLPSSLRIYGALRSAVRDESYRVEFYKSSSCNASGFGEGATFLEATDVTISKNGTCSANNCSQTFIGFIQPSNVLPGNFITAIAIAANGDTSEFSGCVIVTSRFDVIFVDGFD